MSKLIVVCGLSGSGKTTLAHKLSISENATVLSSDEIRSELLGDYSDQSDNHKVFSEMNKRAKDLLSKGCNVIYDATNTSRRRRKHLISHELKMADEKVIYYMNSHYDDCVVNDRNRDRSVGRGVIIKQCKQMQIPVENEGWDKIYIHNNNMVDMECNKKDIENVLLYDNCGHNYLFRFISNYILDIQNIINLPHDSKYHTFSVSRHTYYVYERVRNRTSDMATIYAALLHDVGKYLCKSFVNYKGEIKRYANFYSHENVSAQLALFWLKKMGYDDEFAKRVSILCQFHMHPLSSGDEKMRDIKGLIGNDMYDKLMILHEADLQAK